MRPTRRTNLARRSFRQSRELFTLVIRKKAAADHQSIGIDITAKINPFYGSSQTLGIYGVPPRNPMFTGRTEALAELHRVFVTSGRPAAVSQAAVHGLGGIGKTSVATGFAHQFVDIYDGIWWAPAENRTVLVASLLDLANVLKISLSPGRGAEALAREVLDSLPTAPKPWLLIYDNVTQPADIRDLVPAPGTHLLITTRWTDWSDLAVEIELPLWDDVTAVDFILARTKRKERREEAARLAEALGYLPLALDHAGAYLRHSGISIGDYLTEIAHFLDHSPPDARYPQTVFATFSVAIERAVKEEPAAEQLLAALAVLAPERIPSDLVARMIPDKTIRDAAVAALSVMSLVKHDQFADETPALIIHRLVQAVMYARLESNRRLASAQGAAIAALGAIFPDDPFRRIPLWPQCGKLLPHALRTVSYTRYDDVNIEAAIDVGHNAARFLHGRSELKRAKMIYARITKLSQRNLGCDHPKTIRALLSFGNLLTDAGRFKMARPVILTVIALRRKSLSQCPFEPAYVIPSLREFNQLATLLRDIGRGEEAEKIFSDTLSLLKTEPDAQLADLAAMINNYGNLLYRTGRLEEARPLFEAAIDLGQRTLGQSNADVATWAHNLAMLLLDQKRFSDAEPIVRQASDVIGRELAKEHPNYLRTRVTIAKILMSAGRNPEAYDELARAVIAYKLPLSHTWVLDAVRTLIEACALSGHENEIPELRLKYALS